MSRSGRAEYRACADVTITPATDDTVTNITTTTTATVTDTAVITHSTDPVTESLATTLVSSKENTQASESDDYPHATDISLDTLEEPQTSSPVRNPTHNGIVRGSGAQGGVGSQTPLFEMQNDDSSTSAQTFPVRGKAEVDNSGAEGRSGAATFPATLHFVVILLGYCVQLRETPLSTSNC